MKSTKQLKQEINRIPADEIIYKPENSESPLAKYGVIGLIKRREVIKKIKAFEKELSKERDWAKKNAIEEKREYERGWDWGYYKALEGILKE